MSAESDSDDKVTAAQSPPRERAANANLPPRTQSAPHTESDGNSIQASRRRRLRRARGVSDETPAPESRASDTLLRTQPGSKPGGTDSDPWTVPQSVRDRFVQDGNRFYFPDGAAAFRDLGRKLTTGSENTEVVHSLIEIAHARGWSEVKVAGTERFRQEAWRQARLAGLGVRGYQPTHDEQARVVRTFARSLGRSMRPEEDIRAEAPVATEAAAPPPAAPDSISPSRPLASADRVTGTLLRHGRAHYRHDAREDLSYFVRVQTREGQREIWGRDIERALQKSLTQPQIGDDIVLQRSGQDAVTVRRREREEDGRLTQRPVAAFRTRWAIEKKGFFEERAAAAEIVRNEAVTAQEAVRADPNLANTYLGIRAAELVADKTLNRAEDRRRFVFKVREALAWGLERGDAPPVVKLRDRHVTPRRSERPPPASRATDSPEITR